jgi:hypothetical protein
MRRFYIGVTCAVYPKKVPELVERCRMKRGIPGPLVSAEKEGTWHKRRLHTYFLLPSLFRLTSSGVMESAPRLSRSWTVRVYVAALEMCHDTPILMPTYTVVFTAIWTYCKFYRLEHGGDGSTTNNNNNV